MKLIANKIWDLYLTPILSTFMFVTIITASPTTLTEKMNNQEIETIAVVSQPAAAPQLTPTPVKTDTPSAVPATAPVQPSNSTPVKKEQPQPTRSTSTSNTTSTKKTTSTSNTTTQSTPAKSTSQTKASAVIATSKQYIGVKYVYGGTTPAGFDCSGFVQYVFAKNGINLPRVSRDQYKTGTSVSFSNLRPGDLVFFSLAKNGVVDHVGIYISNGQFINASSSKGVTIYSFGTYWNSAFLGAKRVL